MDGVELLCVGAGLRVSGIVPDMDITGLDVHDGVHAVMDGKMEENSGVAAVYGRERLCVSSSVRVAHIIPCVAVALRDVEVGGVGVIDGEVERHGGVAADSVKCVIGGGIGALKECASVPHQGIADSKRQD